MSVVVTGYGLCTGVRSDLAGVLGGTLEPPAEVSAGAGLPVRRVDDAETAPWVPRRLARKMDRISRITTAAVGQAIQHARLDEPDLVRGTGLVLSTAFGSAGVVSRVLADVLSDDPVISPLLFPNVVANAAAGQASIAFGLRGPNSVLGGVGGLMYAFDMLASGRAERLLVGGFDEMTDVYERALAATDFSVPVRAIGEGAAVVVLETDDAARGRGAEPLAELVAASVASDLEFTLDGASAYAGDGMARSLAAVAAQAPVPELFLGSGWPDTLLRDSEERYVRRAVVDAAQWPKDATGEMFACSAALNAVLAAAAISGDPDAGRPAPRSVVVTAHDSSRGQSEAAYFRAPAAAGAVGGGENAGNRAVQPSGRVA
ncbi:beta-ketoacyl synthase N-terminal-like domain-containing protein [Sinomonas sp. ASV486]|uniref:beta-ketoacyl synthase N-terminal-like domain-containing protein n=1 Tax=Sinomonas sp. ASV486 TaxID=3051170 RepID=UPI0027DC11DC|nr:beta-ketoacyl synthase N-terminal-like domain-containing protein [Sinomonas sp. ASV486]MDQ4492205.1 beta-ketoacyl synthase N-terminal-like domain-containing protein [Sinomonas sp. ASV486]